MILRRLTFITLVLITLCVLYAGLYGLISITECAVWREGC